MKKIFIIGLIGLTGITVNTAYAQLRKIPAEVTNSLIGKFPNATNIEWKDQLVDFKAAFDADGKKYEAKFTNKGEWKLTVIELSINKLPKRVSLGLLKTDYAEWEITGLALVQSPKKNNLYKITVAKNNINKKELLFNPDGQLVKDSFTF
jgi:uncharacterized protein YxeA